MPTPRYTLYDLHITLARIEQKFKTIQHLLAQNIDQTFEDKFKTIFQRRTHSTEFSLASWACADAVCKLKTIHNDYTTSTPAKATIERLQKHEQRMDSIVSQYGGTYPPMCLPTPKLVIDDIYYQQYLDKPDPHYYDICFQLRLLFDAYVNVSDVAHQIRRNQYRINTRLHQFISRQNNRYELNMTLTQTMYLFGIQMDLSNIDGVYELVVVCIPTQRTVNIPVLLSKVIHPGV